MKKKEKGIVMYALCLTLVAMILINTSSVMAYTEDDEVDTLRTEMAYPEQEYDEDEYHEPEMTFVIITSLNADSHVIYLNEDNSIHITVQNIGGDAGDIAYTENVTAVVEGIEVLMVEYEDHLRISNLENAVEFLDDALLMVTQHQREGSMIYLGQRIFRRLL